MTDQQPTPLSMGRIVRSAPVVTLITALLLELLVNTPLNVGNPGVILVLTVIYATFREGLASGLVSAAIAAAYVLHYSISGHGGDVYGAFEIRRDVITGIALPTVALLVNVLRSHMRNAVEQERGLRQASDRERARSVRILDTITDGFLSISPQLDVRFANRRAEQILGVKREQLVGANLLELFPQLKGSWILETVETALESHTTVELEDYFEPADRWYEIRVFPADEEYSLYFRDVTARRKAQESIRYQTRLLGGIGQAVIAADLDGRIAYWNLAAERVFGWTAEEVVGRQGIAMTHAAYTDVEDARLHARLRAGRAWLGEALMVSKSGSTFSAALADSPITEDNGKLIGMVRIVTDLTTRKTIEEEQRFLAEASAALSTTLDPESTIRSLARLVVPTLADCCLVDLVDEDGAIRRLEAAHVDRQKEELAREIRRRYPLEPSTNHPVVDVIRTGKSKLIHRLAEKVSRSNDYDSRHLGMLRDLAFRSAMVVPLAVHGKVIGALSLLTTETEREFTPLDLRAAEELARRAAVAIENARLYEAAVSASRAKSDFLAVMSHELRTPLTTVMGYTDLLLAGVPRPLDDKTHVYIDRIRTAAWHLLSVIEQILVYARLEGGREELHPQRVNLADVLREAAALIEPVAAEKGLGFRVVQPPAAVLETDPAKLRQILLNLLSNAIKFTEQGEVVFEANADHRRVVFSVRDTGIGIPQEYIEKVYDAFWQVDQSSTRQVGGTGLGLSVARRLTRLLGGEISAESTVGVGTAFSVVLPLRWGQPLSPIAGRIEDRGSRTGD
jgi:PAS domain S-box-containing protein